MLNLQKYMVCRTEMSNLDWTLKDSCLTTTNTSFVDILRREWAWNGLINGLVEFGLKQIQSEFVIAFFMGWITYLWSEKSPFRPAAKPTPSLVSLSSSSSRLVSLSSLSSSISKLVSISSSSSFISSMPDHSSHLCLSSWDLEMEVFEENVFKPPRKFLCKTILCCCLYVSLLEPLSRV